MYITATALLCTLLFSCGGDDAEYKNSSLYFDVKRYMTEQTDSLKKSDGVWIKTVTSGETPEEKTTHANELDWATELALFNEADLNKKAYAGKFKIDSDTGTGRVVYTSDGLKIKNVTVSRDSSAKLPRLESQLEISNLFYESEYHLKAQPYQQYEISGSQKIRWFGTSRAFHIVWKKQDRI